MEKSSEIGKPLILHKMLQPLPFAVSPTINTRDSDTRIPTQNYHYFSYNASSSAFSVTIELKNGEYSNLLLVFSTDISRLVTDVHIYILQSCFICPTS
jgi:hypothetical protein